MDRRELEYEREKPLIEKTFDFLVPVGFAILIIYCLSGCVTPTTKVGGSIKSGTETLAKVEIEGVKELCAGLSDPENCIISAFSGINRQLQEVVKGKK